MRIQTKVMLLVVCTVLLPLALTVVCLVIEKHSVDEQTLVTYANDGSGEDISSLDVASSAVLVRGVQNLLGSILEKILLAGALVLIVSALLARKFGGDLGWALIRLRGSAERIAMGDIEHTAECYSDDEIGDLAQAFNKMSRGLKDMVLQVRMTSAQVVHSVQALFSNTQELNSSTQEIARAFAEVSHGATVQADRIGDTFEVMGKTAESIKQVVRDAQATSEAVGLTTRSAEAGKVTVTRAVEKIAKLTHTIAEATGVIRNLGQISLRIGEITDTINTIAEQTNLLALNAAIEAARAGEAGRGFSVVAGEVRKLSEGAADAVRTIAGLIKAIQTESNRAVSAIEHSSQEVEEGKSQVMKIARDLNDINANVDKANQLVTQIAVTGKERVSGIERVVRAIDEISQVSRGAATAAQQVTATTEEQTSSMQEMAASAQELTNLALELEALVSQFKLKDSG